jgi:hypothetical protein
VLLSTTVDDKVHMGIMPLTLLLTLLHYALLVKLLFNFPASLKLPYTDPEKESDHRFTQIVDIVAQQCGLVSRPLYEIKYAQ